VQNSSNAHSHSTLKTSPQAFTTQLGVLLGQGSQLVHVFKTPTLHTTLDQTFF
jgi:hypothetical protein